MCFTILLISCYLFLVFVALLLPPTLRLFYLPISAPSSLDSLSWTQFIGPLVWSFALDGMCSLLAAIKQKHQCYCCVWMQRQGESEGPKWKWLESISPNKLTDKSLCDTTSNSGWNSQMVVNNRFLDFHIFFFVASTCTIVCGWYEMLQQTFFWFQTIKKKKVRSENKNCQSNLAFFCCRDRNRLE